MLAVRLVRLIEAHSDELADSVLTELLSSPRTSGLRIVPAQQLRERSREIILNLSDWLICKSESEIEHRYRELGTLRATQGVSNPEFCWAMVLTKEQIWDFVERQGFLRGPLEIYGALELLRALDQFFEKAICYSAEGFDRARLESAKPVPVFRKTSAMKPM